MTDARKHVAAHALKSESEPRLRAMVKLAESEAPVITRAELLDADPMLLNVKNGTVDLTTGELREHNRSDLITKRAGTEYRPAARDRSFDEFLTATTNGDDELSEFLQRASGYSLTGRTDEEVLFFAHGPTATGKSTFIEAVKGTVGDYAVTADFETFLLRGDRGVPSDIARLTGARFVASVEVDEGATLAEGVVKQLTGGDRVTARFLYRDYFEFTPRFKLWLVANARPQAPADDDALWRRIVQVPFAHVVPEERRDADLKRRLGHDPDARGAILAWAVRGALAWQERGLDVPRRVREYTSAYRREVDPVARWLADRCRLEATATATAGALLDSYTGWATVNGERPLSSRALANALRRHGCSPIEEARPRAWTGVRLA